MIDFVVVLTMTFESLFAGQPDWPPQLVQVTGPQDSRVVFFGAGRTEHISKSPARVRLRSQHRYVFALEGISVLGGRRYGSIEVLRGQALPPGVNALDHPVPIFITERDISTLSRDGMVSKIIVLEDPRKALGISGDEEPIVYETASEKTALQRTQELGEPVLIVRIGSRDCGLRNGGIEELRVSHDATSSAIPQSAIRNPHSYLSDGGDRRPKAGFVKPGRLAGVDPSDTIAEFTDEQGRWRTAESNRVHLFSPRFVEVRWVQFAEGYQTHWLVGSIQRDRAQDLRVGIQTGVESKQFGRLQGIRSRQRTSAMSNEQWDGNFTEVRLLEGLDVRIGWGAQIGVTEPERLSGLEESLMADQVEFGHKLTRIQFPRIKGMVGAAGQIETIWKNQEVFTLEEPPRKPGQLELEKSASVSHAKIGQDIVFVIRYRNIGDRPVHNVAIVDNLTARLEYVPQTAESTRKAIFTAQQNGIGSQILRWELERPLRPSESGIVRFTAKTR